jgi:hypothetical protein
MERGNDQKNINTTVNYISNMENLLLMAVALNENIKLAV